MEINLVSAIVGDVTSAISTFMSGMGTTIVDFFDNVVVKDGQLTVFATWTIIFVGIGFASGLISKLVRKAG